MQTLLLRVYLEHCMKNVSIWPETIEPPPPPKVGPVWSVQTSCEMLILSACLNIYYELRSSQLYVHMQVKASLLGTLLLLNPNVNQSVYEEAIDNVLDLEAQLQRVYYRFR